MSAAPAVAAPSPKTLPERIFGPRTIFGIFMTTGTLHLLKPSTYMEIMPPQLPAHRELVLISGVAEMVGGALYLYKPTRLLGSWWLIALLIAVFPSNVYMASLDTFQRSIPGGQPALIARLPLQFVGIWWLNRLAKRTLARTT